MGLALGMALKVYTTSGKGLKLKVRKLYVLIPTFVEVTKGFLAPPPFPPILSRVNDSEKFWKTTIFFLRKVCSVTVMFRENDQVTPD